MGPEDFNRLVEQAQGLADQDRHAEAFALLQDALAQHPHDVQLLVRAALFSILGAPEETPRLSNRAANLAGEDPWPLIHASAALLAVGEVDKAHRRLVQASEIIPAESPALYSLLYMTGRVAVAKGELSLAERSLTPAFEAEPELLGHGLELARLLQTQQRWDKALEVAEKALGHHPDNEDLQCIATLARLALYGPDSLPPDTNIEWVSRQDKNTQSTHE